MPGNDTTAPPRMSGRLPAALTSMPVQLLLLFVILAAIDLACQWLGARLVYAAPAPLRDAARVLAALILSLAMIASYRFLVSILERRTADELRSSGAVRALAPGVLVGAGLFGSSARSSGRWERSHSADLAASPGWARRSPLRSPPRSAKRSCSAAWCTAGSRSDSGRP